MTTSRRFLTSRCKVAFLKSAWHICRHTLLFLTATKLSRTPKHLIVDPRSQSNSTTPLHSIELLLLSFSYGYRLVLFLRTIALQHSLSDCHLLFAGSSDGCGFANLFVVLPPLVLCFQRHPLQEGTENV